MYRILHIAASFATVLVAYWCYALVAVPFIEPPPKRIANASGTGNVVGSSLSERREAELKEIFPPGSWELDGAKIIQSDQFKLLFKTYDNQGNGLVKLTPCTMVFTTDNEEDDAGNGNERPAPVIMQSPDGALLKFDEALDLKMAKIGKLVGGRLLGRVTVFSHGSKPSDEDDFIFVTNDLLLSETTVSTSQKVQFRFGPHYGSGRDMRIELAQTKGKAKPKPGQGPQVGGIRSLEIKFLEEFHLEIPADDDNNLTEDAAAGNKNNKPGKKQAVLAGKNNTDPQKAAPKKTVPIEINCQGPFRIDLVDNVITFEDQVDVMRFYPKGPSDQINCELLSVHLAKKEKGDTKKSAQNRKGKKKDKPGLGDLEPRRIEALGNPVVVRSPRNDMEARGRQLGYDMKSKIILLDSKLLPATIAAARKKAGKGSLPGLSGGADDSSKAFLRQGPNEIHAVNLQYEPAEAERQIGKLVAQGPGWFRGQMDGKATKLNPAGLGDQPAQASAKPAPQTDKKREPQILEASWQGLLRLRPDEQYKSISPEDKFQTISLSGDAKLTFPGMGRLTADEIHFWMIEPRPLANGKVREETKTGQTTDPQSKDSKTPKPPALKPHSMLACGKQKGKAKPSEMNKVSINSPQLTAVVERLQVWFEEDVATGTYKPRMGTAPNMQTPYKRAKADPISRTAYYPPGVYSTGTPLVGASTPQGTPVPQGIPAGPNMFAPRNAVAPQAAMPAAGHSPQLQTTQPQTTQPNKTEPKNHFHVVGKLLDASVTLGDAAELSKLTITGNVRLEETKTAKPDDDPVVVEGDQIVIRNASRPHATVIVTGTPIKPARFQGQGLSLTGANINLNRGTNRLWMDCPGTMTLPPMKQNTQGQALSAGSLPAGDLSNGSDSDSGPMTVNWQDRMEFDGLTITFEQSVIASSKEQILRTETLKVSLDRMVNFDQTSDINRNKDKQPGVQEVHCRGGVLMESRTFDEKGMLASTELMRAVNLTINNISGDIYAAGPGVVTTVRLGSTGMGAFGNLPSQTPKTPLDPREAPISPRVGNPYQNPVPPISGNNINNNGRDKERLTYLSVTFHGRIEGNKQRRIINFHEDVKAVYGPVATWENSLPDDDPDGVGPEGVILSCRKLSVTSMQTPIDRKQNIELIATGNTLIEGMLFTARGARMSFDQAKDMMILEGDGRNPAALFHQEVVGGPEQNLHAQRIMYRPKTKETKVDNAQSLELLLNQKAMDRPK